MSHLSPFVQACVIASALICLAAITATLAEQVIKRFGAGGRFLFLAGATGFWAYLIILVALYLAA